MQFLTFFAFSTIFRSTTSISKKDYIFLLFKRERRLFMFIPDTTEPNVILPDSSGRLNSVAATQFDTFLSEQTDEAAAMTRGEKTKKNLPEKKKSLWKRLFSR